MVAYHCMSVKITIKYLQNYKKKIDSEGELCLVYMGIEQIKVKDYHMKKIGFWKTSRSGLFCKKLNNMP